MDSFPQWQLQESGARHGLGYALAACDCLWPFLLLPEKCKILSEPSGSASKLTSKLLWGERIELAQLRPTK